MTVNRNSIWWLDKAVTVAALAFLGAVVAGPLQAELGIPWWNALGLGAVPLTAYWWLHVARPVLTTPKR